MTFDDTAFVTTPLEVIGWNQLTDTAAQVQCENGQWYTFDGVNNSIDDEECFICPLVGATIVILFDKQSNPINWRY